MSQHQPASVTWATRMLAVVVALGAVVTVLTAVMRDELIRSWAEGRPDQRKVLRTEGLDAVKNGEVHVPAFVPVTVVLFVMVALLIWVLAAFLIGGYNWARISLTLTLFFLAVGTIAVLRTGAPGIFTALSVASFPFEAAAVYFLWHKDTSAYLRGSQADERDSELEQA